VVGFVALRRLLPDGTLSARPGLPAAVASRGLLAMAFMTTNAFLPLALVEFLDASVAGAGIVLTVAAVSWTAGAFLQAHLSRAWTPRGTARLGLVVVCVGIITSAAVIRSELPILVAYGTWAFSSIGMGLTYNTLSVYALDVAPAGGEGRTAASLQLADPIGAAVGTGIGGVVVATSLGFPGFWAIMAAVTVVGFAAASGLAQPATSSSATVSGM
ncbi:MAG: MFS transporter, partial [Gemmatimonadetes bacterium]|nr:MFS transporter [Gemmatimonadota bacterium]